MKKGLNEKELREDVELLKLSLLGLTGIKLTVESFERGKYGGEDLKFFRENWNNLKERAKQLKLLKL